MTGSILFSMLTPKIGELVVSNPKKRNALNAAMWASLPGVLQKAAQTPELKVLIVRGDGDHFAAGADISEFEELYATRETAKDISDHINNGFKALADFPLPTVGMIRGACVGGGCGFSLCCDVRFADNTARFGITPGKLGLVYPYSDVQRLIETVGIPHAKDMLFAAQIMKAKRAEKIGLINRRFKPDELEGEVLAYAEAIAALSTQSIQVMKKMFASYQSGQFGDNTQSMEWFLDGFVSDDFQEGYRAFLEKRKPNF